MTYTILHKKKTVSLFLHLEQKLGQAVQLECYKVTYKKQRRKTQRKGRSTTTKLGQIKDSMDKYGWMPPGI
jgi:hypothetical protein